MIKQDIKKNLLRVKLEPGPSILRVGKSRIKNKTIQEGIYKPRRRRNEEVLVRDKNKRKRNQCERL
jgi:hypothetical protein